MLPHPFPSLEQLRQELATPLPHPDPAAIHELGRAALDWVAGHWASLPEQAVGRTGTRSELENLLREPPPEHGSSFEQVLADFQEKVATFAFRINHPRFLAFVPAAPTFWSVLADWLCAGTNFFAGVWLEAAGPAQVELVVLDWFKQFLNYPAQAGGLLTGGGSEANLTALLVARERLSYAQRADAVLYVSEQRHWSMDRAAKVIGLRPDQVRPVPVSAAWRLEPAALRAAVQQDRDAGRQPWAAAATAGTTNTGTVDPIAALADVCREERLWLHVDAAYGWPAVLVPAEQPAFAGIEQADSITLDPHKWFGQTYECGCLLVRDGRGLAEAFALRPDYMQDIHPAEDEVNFCDLGLALTRRFRALKVWLSVKVLGVAWFRALVARCCRLADYAQKLLEHAGVFEIVCPRQLSIVCFRCVPPGPAVDSARLDQLNLEVTERLRATGRAFLSSTRLNGRVALRLCFVNWRTTAADVEEVVTLLQELAKPGERGASGPRGVAPSEG